MYKKHGNEKGTNKFQKFALRVAMRIKSGKFARYQSASGKLASDHQAVAQVLVDLLEAHNVKEVRIPSLNEACELIAQALQSGRVSAKAGESAAQLKTVNQGNMSKRGESIAQPATFAEETLERQVSVAEQVGESVGSNFAHFVHIFHCKEQK